MALAGLSALAEDAAVPAPAAAAPATKEAAKPAGREMPRGPMSPIIAALDVNSDGVIDEKEIAGAAEALKKLDKNGDGKLTMDEIRPSRPGGPGGEGRRDGGARKHGGDQPPPPAADQPAK